MWPFKPKGASVRGSQGLPVPDHHDVGKLKATIAYIVPGQAYRDHSKHITVSLEFVGHLWKMPGFVNSPYIMTTTGTDKFEKWMERSRNHGFANLGNGLYVPLCNIVDIQTHRSEHLVSEEDADPCD